MTRLAKHEESAVTHTHTISAASSAGDSPDFAAKTRKSRYVAAVLAILFGIFGVHKFYLGMFKTGFEQLAIAILAWIFNFVVGMQLFTSLASIFALVEGVMYVSKTDEAFFETYVVERRQWL